MSISSIVSRVIPTAVGFVTGGPVGAFTAAAATESAKRDERQVKRQINELNAQRQQILENNMAFGDINVPGAFPTPRPQSISTASSGGGLFDTLRGGLREIGGFTQDLFSSGLPQIFGYNRPPSVVQQPAFTTTTNVGAQESQGSGSIQAGVGSLLPQVLGGARALLKSPGGQLALGTGAGAALSFMSPDGKKMRITRKMKSQARTVLNIAGGNISIAADILNISDEMLITILLKRFRNDGPVVTKAALRKTKQTVRRLKNMCDMYDSLRPTATRRRAPMRRASSTTLIKN